MKLTEIRVDGGEWKPYVEEETILNSAADLAKWAQAGPGGLTWVDRGRRLRPHVRRPGHAVVPGQGLRRLLAEVPVARLEHGHDRQRRRVRALPESRRRRSHGRRRSATRARSARRRAIPRGSRSSAATRSRSTTTRTPSRRRRAPSTTSRRSTPRRRRCSRGGRGSTTRSRSSARRTRSSATARCCRCSRTPRTSRPRARVTRRRRDRQFTRGYVGLQNHGTSDLIDYRNIRVLPLDAGSVRGPVTVSGDGAHKVEYRSTDVAGNRRGGQVGRLHDRRLSTRPRRTTTTRSTRRRRARAGPTAGRSA